MAIAHLTFKSSSKAPPAASHAKYIMREGRYRHCGEAGLVTYGNLPEFALDNPRTFWEAADAHERANGRAYTELQMALPRELDNDQRKRLALEAAHDLLGDRFAYTLAIHQPVAKDNIDQPHLHLMFSERAINESTRRLPEERFFKRNGAKKDPAWNSRTKPEEVRERWCELMNRAMEAASVEQRVDPRSWADQGRDDLAALREPKLLGGDGEEAKFLHAHVGELRRKRATLPEPHLSASAALKKLEQRAKAEIERLEQVYARELSRVDQAIAAVKRAMADFREKRAVAREREEQQRRAEEVANASVRYQEIAAELILRYGYGIRPRDQDQLIAERLAAKGHSEEAIAAAIQTHSRNDEVRQQGTIEGYAQRFAQTSFRQRTSGKHKKEIDRSRGD